MGVLKFVQREEIDPGVGYNLSKMGNIFWNKYPRINGNMSMMNS